MKTKTKILLAAISLGVVVLLGATGFFLWSNPGGMRSDYPAKDNDPRLLKIAQRAAPVIQGIESYKSQKGRLPETLADIESSPPEDLPMNYTSGSDNYTLWIKLGWDPSLTFSSRDRSWTFDPGDGSPRKNIRLEVGQ